MVVYSRWGNLIPPPLVRDWSGSLDEALFSTRIDFLCWFEGVAMLKELVSFWLIVTLFFGIIS